MPSCRICGVEFGTTAQRNGHLAVHGKTTNTDLPAAEEPTPEDVTRAIDAIEANLSNGLAVSGAYSPGEAEGRGSRTWCGTLLTQRYAAALNSVGYNATRQNGTHAQRSVYVVEPNPASTEARTRGLPTANVDAGVEPALEPEPPLAPVESE